MDLGMLQAKIAYLGGQWKYRWHCLMLALVSLHLLPPLFIPLLLFASPLDTIAVSYPHARPRPYSSPEICGSPLAQLPRNSIIPLNERFKMPFCESSRWRAEDPEISEKTLVQVLVQLLLDTGKQVTSIPSSSLSSFVSQRNG